MRKLGLFGMALLAGFAHTATGADPRNQISTADNKRVALPDADAAANLAPTLTTRSALAAEETQTGKTNTVKIKNRPLNLTAKRGLATRKHESPKLLTAMVANPSKLANLKANESKPNALAADVAERTEAKASNLQQVTPMKMKSTSNLRQIPALVSSDNGGKS